MSPYGIGRAAWSELERESLALLSSLVRIDTSNPPGNETPCAELLQRFLADAGVRTQLVGETPAHMNLVARLPGTRPGPTLLLLGHTDVVPAEATEWQEAPFSGVVKNGYLWGRGALDMKNQLAAAAVAMARLARAGATFAGELLFAATADEERGDHCGARWLVAEHPDLVRCDYLINEGGGSYVRIGRRRLYTFTVGEKGYAQFRVRAKGRGGHGSVPLHKHNAVTTMARAIVALAEHRPPVHVTDTAAAYIERLIPNRELAALLTDGASSRETIAAMHAAGDERAYLIEPLLGITFSPTIAHAGGEAPNVIPSHAEAIIDCRTLPGHTEHEVETEVRRALAGLDGTWDLEWVDVMAGNESPADGPLAAALRHVLAAMVPRADLVPTHLCGFTDSRWFRAAFPEVTAYGFCPFDAEDAVAMGGREHARDERIAVSDVPFQALFMERLVTEVLR